MDLNLPIESLNGIGPKRGALLPKLAILYTEKLQKLDLAVAAWKSLLDSEPDNRRAQDALRKLYLQSKDWDALEGFYSAQSKWDEFVRVLERQAETEADDTRVGLWHKIALLYQDRLGKPEVDALLARLNLAGTMRAEQLEVDAMLALCEAVRAAMGG